jgi:uncharacterized membrane protein (DUF2068 family)
VSVISNSTQLTDGPGAPTRPIKKRAPTLYAIIVMKLLKAALFITLAIVAYALSDNDLPYEYQRLLHFLGLNADRRFFARLGTQIGTLTEGKVLWAAAWTLAYSLFSLVEGIGLMLRVSWAGWLAIGESAFFIPVEICDLIYHRFSITVVAIMGINILIVWYLLKNREQFFRQHHQF